MIRQYENETFVKRSRRALKGWNQGQKLSIIRSQVNANLVGWVEVERVWGKRGPSQREHCCASSSLHQRTSKQVRNQRWGTIVSITSTLKWVWKLTNNLVSNPTVSTEGGSPLNWSPCHTSSILHWLLIRFLNRPS
jgi:hypothetical protein